MDLGDKIASDEKQQIEAAIESLKEAMKGENKEEIEAKTEHLTEASSKMAERLYAQKAPEGDGGQEKEAGGPESTQSGPSGSKGDNVVDAEFEEVKDDNKK